MQLVYGGKDQCGNRWWQVQVGCEGSSDPIPVGKIWEPQFFFVPEKGTSLSADEIEDIVRFMEDLKQRSPKQVKAWNEQQDFIQRVIRYGKSK